MLNNLQWYYYNLRSQAKIMFYQPWRGKHGTETKAKHIWQNHQVSYSVYMYVISRPISSASCKSWWFLPWLFEALFLRCLCFGKPTVFGVITISLLTQIEQILLLQIWWNLCIPGRSWNPWSFLVWVVSKTILATSPAAIARTDFSALSSMLPQGLCCLGPHSLLAGVH